MPFTFATAWVTHRSVEQPGIALARWLAASRRATLVAGAESRASVSGFEGP